MSEELVPATAPLLELNMNKWFIKTTKDEILHNDERRANGENAEKFHITSLTD